MEADEERKRKELERKKKEEEAKRLKEEREIKMALGFTEEEIQEECDELFKEAPIDFEARRGNKLEEKMGQIIYDKHIKIPIILCKGSVYLIGSQKHNCELRAENVVIRTGGGYVRFEDFVPENEKYF